MTSRRHFFASALCALALLHAPGSHAGDDLVVIIHKDNPYSVDKDYVIGIYTGRTKGWPDGSPVFPLDQGEASAARAAFYASVVGRSQGNMQALWAQNIFSGKGLPPKVATPDTEMKRIVSTNRNAIGYIRASELDSTVKVLLR